MKRVLLTIAISVTLLSCGITKNQRAHLDSWLNHSSNELIMSWGLPTVRDNDGAGGEVLLYQRDLGYAYGDHYFKNTSFFADRNGKIYRWAQRKVSQPMQQIQVRRTW